MGFEAANAATPQTFLSPAECAQRVRATDPALWNAEVDALFVDFVDAFRCRTGLQSVDEGLGRLYADAFRALGLDLDVQLTEAVLRRLVTLCVSVWTAARAEGSAEALADAGLMCDAYGAFVFHVIRGMTERAAEEHHQRVYFVGQAVTSVVAALRAAAVPAVVDHFDQCVFLRLLRALLGGTCSPPHFSLRQAVSWQATTIFAKTLHTLNPQAAPHFLLSWVALVSDARVLPAILQRSSPRAWQLAVLLIEDLLAFLAPFIARSHMPPAVRAAYFATLRLLTAIDRDWPAFLTMFAVQLTNRLPPAAMQLRNMLLAAHPRTKPLPDTSDPDLKVDLLPENNQEPTISPSPRDALAQVPELLTGLSEYVGGTVSVQWLRQLQTLLRLPAVGAPAAYNLPLVNMLALQVVIEYSHHIRTHTATATDSTPLRLAQHILAHLDPEGRYHFVNGIVSQLRYPNAFTIAGVMMLLYLARPGDGAVSDDIQEIVLRCLFERRLSVGPHPWGLTVTLEELATNSEYAIRERPFVLPHLAALDVLLPAPSR
jgi:hypothetical protein